MRIPTFDDVLAAHARIAPHVHRTPVMTSRFFDRLTGAELLFKCENLQRAGAFKARGASNAVFELAEAAAARGVATHSSGNHGQALAWAAGRRGIQCTVVMPQGAARAKRAAVAGYGARVVDCAPSADAREAALAEVVAATGAEFVHPYDDARVIAGQGTCAKELVEQAGALDAVVAPVGGGGLVSGTCLTVGALAPGAKVYGAEPLAADDAARSLHTGKLVAYDAPRTVADGLRVPLRGLTWHFVRAGVADVLTVEEAEIVAAMRMVWERMKLVVEPSSAVAVAAVLKHPELFAGRRVGVILTGGNVDLDRLPWQG